MKPFSLLLALSLCFCFAPGLAEPALVQTGEILLQGETVRYQVFQTATPAPEDGWMDQVLFYREDGQTQALPPVLFPNLENDGLARPVSFADLNFDGEPDLLGLYVQGATNQTVTVFLYRGAETGFVEERTLASLSNYQLYPKQKLIVNHLHNSAATFEKEMFAVEDGQPRLARVLSVMEQEPDFESVLIKVSFYDQAGAESVQLEKRVTVDELYEEYLTLQSEWEPAFWQGLDQSEEPVMPYAADEEPAAFYNPDGGQYYHADANCPSVSKKYLPLQPITEQAKNEKSLAPCPICVGGSAR